MKTTEILVIDDSLSIRKMVQYVLQSKGYRVVTAVDGQEALEKVMRNNFKLIICDINMPRLDGFEFLKRIKIDSELAGIPVIILSTEGKETDRETAQKLGASDYLIKPFNPGELLERIQRQLGE